MRHADAARMRRPIVLVFGENEHDRKAILHLVEGMRPDLAGTIETRRKPLVLLRSTQPQTARDNARRIACVARAEAKVRNLLAVLAHEDCDATEPAHTVVARRIETALQQAECPGQVIAVTPAWEIEAWWMIFPEAVGAVVKGWREPDDWIGRDVGQVRDAKEKLARAVQPRPLPKPPPRPYEEHDSIQIALNIKSGGLLASFDRGCRASHAKNRVPKRTSSASFEAFRVKVHSLSAHPKPPQ